MTHREQKVKPDEDAFQAAVYLRHVRGFKKKAPEKQSFDTEERSGEAKKKKEKTKTRTGGEELRGRGFRELQWNVETFLRAELPLELQPWRPLIGWLVRIGVENSRSCKLQSWKKKGKKACCLVLEMMPGPNLQSVSPRKQILLPASAEIKCCSSLHTLFPFHL